MGKMRIYEFAKELGKESGEIIAALGLRGHVTASSGITEADKEKVRKKLFGETPKAAPKAPEKVEAPKAAPETQSSKDNAAEEAPKKKKIVAVFRPQNSRSGMMSRQEHGGRPLRRRPVDANGHPVPTDAAGRPLRHPAIRQAAESSEGKSEAAPKAPSQEAKTASPVQSAAVSQPQTSPAPQIADDKAAPARPVEEGKTAPAAGKAPSPKAPEAPKAQEAPKVQAAQTPQAPQTSRPSQPPKSTPKAEAPKAPEVKAPEAPKTQAPQLSKTVEAKTQNKAEDTPKAASVQNRTEAPKSTSSSEAAAKSQISTDRSSRQGSGTQTGSFDRGGQRSSGQARQGQGGENRVGQRSSFAGGGTFERGQSRQGGYSQGQRNSGQGQGQRPAGYSQGQGQRSGGYSQGQGQRSGGYSQGQGQRSGGFGQGQGQRSGGYGQGQGQRSGGGYGQGQGQRSGGFGQGQGQRSGGFGGGQRTGGAFAGVGQRSGGFGGAPVGAGKPGAPARGFGQNRNAGSGKAKPVFGDAVKNPASRRGQAKRGQDRDKFNGRFDQDERIQGGRKKKDPNRAGAFHKPEAVVTQAPEDAIKTVTLPEILTLRELAEKIKQQPNALIKKLFLQGKMVTLNQEISYEEAEAIALEYDILCEKEVKKDLIADLLKEDEDPEEKMVPRAPVVCVMGHVDHGKTSLLDAIRDTHVSDREAGGITQHIGASVIDYNGRKITFLDTPGHEAFTAMRMRGANSTDIAVLVVAADDGVMPQTVEAINHAKAAGIEIIVAINKIDKPSANVEKVKQELTEYELVSEDWGGSTIMVPVSAKSHEGIDNLLEMLLLTADVLELKANPDRRARGVVIEAKLDKGRGPVASLLVQKGILHVGDPICAGACHGKVRAMTDDKGHAVESAGPSTPVEVIGFSDVPGAGEIFLSPETEKEAKSFAETFISVGREKMLEETRSKMSLDDLFTQIKEGNLKELNLILKADVQGSAEALRQSLLKLSNDEVVVKIIHSAVGAINESDVTLASASNAIIIGFNVRPDAMAKSTAEHEGVDIRLYRVIYDAINDVESAMKGMLEPIYVEKVTGHVEVRQIFRASGIGSIAGSYVLDGTIQRGSKARISRDGKKIYEGQIASLKRFKDDVKEVKAGYECGLVFDGFNDIAEGDQVEAYTMVEVPRT